MQRQYVLYNPHANNGRGEVQARTLEGKLAENAAEFVDATDFLRNFGVFNFFMLCLEKCCVYVSQVTYPLFPKIPKNI